jgi:hypothetical protein
LPASTGKYLTARFLAGMVISRRSNAAAAKEQPLKSSTLGSQFGSEWWQNGAPFKTQLRTRM